MSFLSLNQSGISFDNTVIEKTFKQENLSANMDEFQDYDLGDLLSDQMQDFDSLKRQIQQIDALIKGNKPISVLTCREGYAKHLWIKCQSRNSQIYRIATDEDKKTLAYFSSSEFATMEKLIFEAFDALAERQAELQPREVPAATPPAVTTNLSESHVRLARIEIPKFSGKQTEWQSYRDTFTSLVKNNRTYDNVTKMWHLRTSLEGEAFDLICTMDVTNANFEVAWDLLIRQYNNTIALTNAHLNALFAIDPIKKESPIQLRNSRNSIIKHLGALKQLGRGTDGYDDILINRAVVLLDPRTKRDWELSLTSKTEYPKFDEFDKFLLSRIQVLESLETSSSESTNVNNQTTFKSKTKPQSPSIKSHLTSTTDQSCQLCKENHNLFKCEKFRQISPIERFDLAKTHKWCINCLKPNHKLTDCKSDKNCFKCQKRHHTWLHRDLEIKSKDDNSNASGQTSSESGMQIVNKHPTLSHLSCSTAISHTNIQLGTAHVWILAPSHRAIRVRALIDPGSTWSFVSRDLVRALGVRTERISESLSGVGESDAGPVSSAAQIRISANHHGHQSVHTTTMILPKITAYKPKYMKDLSSWSHFANLDFADDFSNDDPIHVLIGANIYGAFLLDGLRKGKIDEPIAQKTIFGWIVSGNMQRSNKGLNPTPTYTHMITNSMLNSSLQQFWEIEEIPQQRILSVDDEKCETHFQQTHKRTNDGRYIVQIPFNSDLPLPIGNSRYVAESSLKTLERRLAKNINHRLMYSEFMKEYETMNHMQEVIPSTKSSNSLIEPVYLPHHAVFRENSQTTKLRVVFNASSKTSNGTSLNDFMYKGPALQADLVTIILNWRSYEFVFTADLARMYRNILLDENHIDFQRILWRYSPDEPIKEYQLSTVTYGTRSAPFLALRVVKQLVEDEGESFPLASQILLHDTFVDDLLFGAHKKSDALAARNEVISLLDKGKFQARKWTSNSRDLLTGIDPSDHGLAWTAPTGENDGIKLLGINWNMSDDTFGFKVSIETPKRVTKRTALSLIAKLFDPMGWISPVIIVGKCFIQDLFRENYSWDDSLAENLTQSILAYFHSLNQLTSISIPRWTEFSPNALSVQIHGFSDASQRAYGAAIYLRIEHSNGRITTTLLASKSKVAPIKSQSIPRLELQAALLLARLLTSIRNARSMTNLSFQCWTDASIVLTWLSQHPANWKTFIANRVSEIHSLLPDHIWRHVPTKTNPADLVSRGMSVSQLVDSSLWWQGPSWLSQPQSDWPENLINLPSNVDLEKSAKIHVNLAVFEFDQLSELYTRCSKWNKILRVVAYVLKAKQIFLHKVNKQTIATKLLTASDINAAEQLVLRHLQSILFPLELSNLQNNVPLPKKSKLSSLTPCLTNSIIRVGGRLDEADLPFDTRHPVILARHRVTILIIKDAHRRCLHGGVRLTLSTLRDNYWVINARNLVKSVVYNCLECTKVKAKLSHQIMASLPKVRITRPPRAFTDCGVDYAGPIQVRLSPGRGYKSQSSYIALFVCFAVKAIHLELVSNYSSDAFIAAFKRFTSRRGLPERMYSDCGTNLRGADRLLKNAFDTALSNTEFQSLLANDRITWNYNPPAAPHFGGLWEAGVRSVKGHLTKILKNRTPTFEELTTIICQIEGVVNSRPLGPLNDDIDSFKVLTPGHFLAGGSLVSIPQPSLIYLKENRLSRWEAMQQCSEIFWHKWSTDYLQSLQQRTKWRFDQLNIKLGQLVLLKQPNLPASKWLLGRITECIPGRDGKVRTVRVKTEKSTFLRPITEIALLPVDLELDNADSECTR